MKRTILFPTDFTIESLKLVKTVLSNSNPDVKYDLILLHGMHSSKSITDLLFISREKILESLVPSEFDDACHVIKNKFHSQINSIKKDLFSGITRAAFDNYLEANKVDEAYIPLNYNFNMINKNSFNIIPYIKKADLRVTEIDLRLHTAIPEKGRLAEVFFNDYAAS